jgi:peptidoglycan/xylan/chitin deacetylase (PgdA/CDA1 family)
VSRAAGGALAALVLVAGTTALGCGRKASPAGTSGVVPSPPSAEPSSALASPVPSVPPVPSAPPAQLDGRSFPDKTIALTWDDGPDVNTLALARYLAREKVSATFFVVREWIEGVSDSPGSGRGVFETGYRHLPILGDLVALGHRVANHTLNHALLDTPAPGLVAYQLGENQRFLDPFITGGLALFRAPGGAWSAASASAQEADPSLRRLVGPVRWDVDEKDWEGSLHCSSSRPAVECEPAAPGGALRVKPSVMANRYVAAIEAAGHGIVLLHDRVGHVGSDYALRLAETMIPELEARGFVFAAPVLSRPPIRSDTNAAPATAP